MDPQARTCRNSLKNEAPATAGADKIGSRLHGFKSGGDNRGSGVDAPGSAKKLRDDAASTLQDALALRWSQNDNKKKTNIKQLRQSNQKKNKIKQNPHTHKIEDKKTINWDAQLNK